MDYLTILFIFLAIYRVNCEMIAPNNTILLIGQNPLNFSCTSKDIPTWYFSNEKISASDLVCGSSINPLFIITRTSLTTCNLYSPNITLDHAGNYSCIDGKIGKDFITVVTGPLKCKNNATETSISNPVELRCSAIISKNAFEFAFFTWNSLSSTSAIQSSPANTYDNNNITSIITTNPQNLEKTIPAYNCTLQLKMFGYSNSSQTLAINVHYYDFKNGLKISGNSDNSISYGTHLVCNFNSNPVGTISWQYSNGTTIVSSPSLSSISFPVIKADNYTCSIDYQDNLAGNYKNSLSVLITNVSNVPTTTITASSSIPDFKKSEADIENKIKLAIGLSVGLVVFLIIIAFIVGISLRKKIAASRNKTINEYEMTNSISDNHIYADLNKNTIRNNDYENINQ